MTADAEYLVTLRAGRTGTAHIATVTEGPTPTKYATPTPIPDLPDGAPISNLTPPAPLYGHGQVLIFGTGYPGTLWAVNADGTGMRALMDEKFVAFAVSPESSMQSGIIVAYITREGDSLYLSGDEFILKVASPPDSEPQTIATLVDKESKIADYQSAMQLEWSHDGRRLAFIGGIEGDTADVYTYSFDTGEITRLSDGPNLLSTHIEWSPDDQYIKYEAFDFIPPHDPCCGDIWVVPTGEKGPGRMVGRSFIAWLSDHTAALDEPVLKLVDAATGETTVLYEHHSYTSYSPQDNLFLVSPNPWSCDDPQALMLIQPGGSRQTLPFAGCGGGYWVGHGWKLGSEKEDKTLILITTDGQVIESPFPVNDYSNPEISDDGQYWAWPNACCVFGPEGLWISTRETNARQIVAEGSHVWHVAWVPGEQSMFFLSGDSLYMASAPDFAPVLVSRPDLYLEEFMSRPTWVP